MTRTAPFPPAWLMPRRRRALGTSGVALVLAGYFLWPRAVSVDVHPRREPESPFWRGALSLPAVPDGGFFLQKLVNHYRSPPLPFPDETPPYRVRFEMRLVARAGGTYGFELDSPWHGALDVSRQRVFGSGPMAPGLSREGSVSLDSGIHQATLWVQPAGDPDQPIRLLWKEPGGRLRPVTAVDLTVEERPLSYAASARLAAPLVWLGALLVSLATSLWVLGAKRDSRRTVALGTLLVTALALLARAAHFDTQPRGNIDETHNAWAGYNLIHEGHPRSWSWHPVSPNTRVLWFSYDYPIVADAFDHPPLLPLLAGLEATALGARTMFDCVLPRIRPLMVVFGSLSVGILFLLALEIASFPTAFLAATLAASSPLVVFNSRLVKEDGLVQLFLVLAVYAYLLRRKGDSESRATWLAAVSSGLCAAAKVMGIAVGFALSAVAFAERPRRLWPPALLLGVSLLFASLYPLYGLALDWDAFRGMGHFLSATYPRESLAEKFLILPRIILEPRVSAVTPLVDGWVLLGWLSLHRLFRERAISVTFVSYLLVLMVTVSSRNVWGFYLAPLFPFLCLAAALEVRRALARLSFLSVFLAVGLGFLPQYAALPGALAPGGFRGLAVLAFLPLLPAILRLRQEHPARAAARLFLGALLVLGVLANLGRCLTTL